MSNTSRRKGQFAVGNSGGPGNPHVRKLAAYRKAFAEADGPEEVKRVCREIYEKAMADDIAAAQVFLEAYFDAVDHQGR